MICFIDFETTGIDVFKDNPIEIGAVLVDRNLKIVKKFHSFIQLRTKRKASKTAMTIHGIDHEFLENQPTQKEVLINFFDEFGTNFNFGCWNMNFDVSFFRRMCHLNNEMMNYNRINYRHLDIQSIVTYLHNMELLNFEGYSLSDLAKFLSIERSNNHSALEDAEIIFNIYVYLRNINLSV